MDSFFGMNMQKPMLGDPSGLTDTMWDLNVDSLGALAISSLGWRYTIRERQARIEFWICRFIGQNPRIFRSS